MKINLRCTAAIAAAKVAQWVCKHTGFSGTSLPGKIALIVDPRILAEISPQFQVIAVTGTNGKTTTTGILSRILDANGCRHLTNRSGANMITGIASTFLEGVDLSGKGDCAWALLEVDEATVRQFCKWVKPRVLVVTNFFRDQLDRYGEVTHVVEAVLSGVDRSKDMRLVLNADDALSTYLGIRSKKEAVYFGIEQGVVPAPSDEALSLTLYCPFCKSKLEESYRVFGHLGGFHCPRCGFERPAPEVRCTGIEKVTPEGTAVRINLEGKDEHVRVHLPGIFNVYNALAAVACSRLLGLPFSKTAQVLESAECCFGRMESIPGTDGRRILLMLVKNPIGFNQILTYLVQTDQPLYAAFLINDKDQDGTDISWLWDVDFEKLMKIEGRISRIYASGLRAEDMALRLKYAGLPEEKIQIEKSSRTMVQQGFSALPRGGTFYIASTYTAMLELRSFLKKKFGLKEIWQ